LFEIVVDTLARAKNNDGVPAGCPRPEGSNVPAGADPVLQADYALNDCDKTDYVKQNHKSHRHIQLTNFSGLGRRMRASSVRCFIILRTTAPTRLFLDQRRPNSTSYSRRMSS